MSFLNPLMLFGLLGAAVPIIIHLIHKRKPRSQTFGAIELVMRSVERVQRRWRLRRFLLLAARMLLLAALALAAAGPLIGRQAELTTRASGPERLAIVIDASLSMRARYDGTTSFSRALTAARNLVDGMGPEDQAVIVWAGGRTELVVERPTADRALLLRKLDDLEASFAPSELGEAVTTAAQALGSSDEAGPDDSGELPEVSGRVVVLSDLARGAVQTQADVAIPGTSSRARLEVFDVLAERAGPRVNRGLIAIETRNVPGEAPRTVELRTRVQSFAKESGESQPVDITLRAGDRDLFAGSVEVVPGTIVDKPLRHAFDQPGHVPVQVVLEGDGLAEDDVRYAVAEVRRQVRTLIVDGAPSGLPKQDEVYYFERALLAGAADQPPPRVITADDLGRTDLSAFDVVVLAGVDAFTRDDASRLVEFVERGGGLLVTASETMDVELYNAALGSVLPRQLRGIKVVDAARGGVGSSGVVTLGEVNLEHPVIRIFEGDGLGGLLSTQTQAYLLLRPDAERHMTVLAKHSDGQPALVEGRAGQGRVAILTVSVDRDMTDLPIRPAFVPLARQLVLHLGDALAEPDLRETLVGQTREIRVPSNVQAVRVTGPDGSEQTWTASEIEGARLRFDATAVPGHYRVEAAFTGPLEPLRGEAFAVNVDPRESDLTPVSEEEARAVLLGGAAPGAPEADSAAQRARILSAGVSPEQLAGILLLIMFFAFFVESALTASRPGR